MSNNTPDYKDNLVFEPKMTWEELCEYAKSKQLDVVSLEGGTCFIDCNGIALVKGNMIWASRIITRNRTYEQMKTIIEALWG